MVRKLLSLLLPFVATAFVLCSTGCGSEGEGTVHVTAWGEDYAEEGIFPPKMEDGWSVVFDRFEIGLRDVVVAGAEVPAPSVIDISASSNEGHPVGSVTVPSGDYENPNFTITRIRVHGSATKDDETKTFEWHFDRPTRYFDCEATVSVPEGGETTFEITLHADHLFFDSLVSDDPQVLFQPLADADADDDGEITQAELAAADLGAYDPGSEGGVDDLWAFLSAQAALIGHVDGEGHCESEPVTD